MGTDVIIIISRRRAVATAEGAIAMPEGCDLYVAACGDHAAVPFWGDCSTNPKPLR